jgi:hypothetical protein
MLQKNRCFLNICYIYHSQLLIFLIYNFKSSSKYILKITLSIFSLFLLKKSSTVFIAILLACSLGKQNTPVDIQGNAIFLILFFIAKFKEFI